MREDGTTPPEILLCGRCGSPYDPEDNFCRCCGLSLHDARLPSLRDDATPPAVWRPPLPAVVARGAAFIAAGTVAEMLVRRLVRGAFGRSSGAARALQRREQAAVNGDESLPADAHMVSETLLLRRIRFRR